MTQKKEEFLDIKQFFYRIASNWLLFLLSILLCLAIAFGFNRYTKNIFKVSSTILFEDQSNISSISAAEAIYSNDPSNQIVIELDPRLHRSPPCN